MAEGRMLKKVISTSRRLADLKTDSARMLYAWIIPHLDIEGRMYAEPSIIKGRVVPRLKLFTEHKIKECLLDMARVGVITLYSVDGDEYLQLRKFGDYQTLRPEKEAKSTIPAPLPEDSNLTPALLPDKDGTTPDKEKIREDKRSKEKGARAIPSPKMKFLDSVFLTAHEHQKLTETIGQKNLETGIEQLDYSITVKGGKYKDHHKTILNWHKRGFLKNNDQKTPPPSPGERDVREYEPEEMQEVTEEQRKINLKRLEEMKAGIFQGMA